jgi:hypothetical protein
MTIKNNYNLSARINFEEDPMSQIISVFSYSFYYLIGNDSQKLIRFYLTSKFNTDSFYKKKQIYIIRFSGILLNYTLPSNDM